MFAPCTCTTGPCHQPSEDMIVLGPEVPLGRWSTCIHGALRDPMLVAAANLEAQAQVSPLQGWPDAYSVGVVDCILALRMERQVEQRRQLEEDR